MAPAAALLGAISRAGGGAGHECGACGAQQFQQRVGDVADVALQVGHHHVRVGGGAGAPQLDCEKVAAANACIIVWGGAGDNI